MTSLVVSSVAVVAQGSHVRLGTEMYFYEIHEGDEDLGTAVLLGHEQAFSAADFFAIVKKARKLVLGSYEEDTLSEAIANELERSSGFIHITDERLLASVNVDESEEGTYVVASDDATRSVYVRRDDERDDERLN